MIHHIVLTKVNPDTSEEKIADIYAGLKSLSETLPGARSFTGGRSESPEQMERGYTHGFVIDFDSWDALHRYAENETHKALGAQLVAHAIGGIDGILVMDLDV